MENSKYKIERTIEDIIIEEETLKEVRETVQEEMQTEGKTPNGIEFEKRVREKLLDIAQQQTIYSQGENRLHNNIEHKLVKEEDFED